MRSTQRQCAMLALRTVCWCLLYSCVSAVRLGTGAYHGINVEIAEELALQPQARQRCQQILTDLELTLTDASAALYSALHGRYYFGDFNVLLPAAWEDTCIPLYKEHKSSGSTAPLSTMSSGGPSDVTVTTTHTLHGDGMWTLQAGGCGQPGQQIYLPQRQLGAAHSGRAFVREWAKYRYGVFDEIGYSADAVYAPCYYDGAQANQAPAWQLTGCTDAAETQHSDNAAFAKSCQAKRYPQDLELLLSTHAHSSLMFAPHGPNVSSFCTATTHNRYAPTKQNYLCDRRSTWEIIEQHADFAHAKNANATSEGASTRPLFHYRRRMRTRFVFIVEDTQDMAQRESWHFLRSAFRKWILYDLMPQSEVGVVLANDHAVERQLAPVLLQNATNRDLVASFLPYTPSDASQSTCMACAIAQAQRMLAQRRQHHGAAAEVVVLVAPGIETTSVADVAAAFAQLAAAAIRTVTINYPSVLGARRPLDALAVASVDRLYSVYEQKYNSERSYLTTYVQLSNVLMDIASSYCEGLPRPPVEIHRHEIYDTTNDTAAGAAYTASRNTRLASGHFYLESSLGAPAGFYIYTHSAETPLIQALHLVAPSGRSYSTRSDQRMSVKQLTLLSALNETGLWRYEIERYPGNPQPHVVQVIATPRSDSDSITMRAWVQRVYSGTDSYLLLTCVLQRGRYAVVNALVQATVHYHQHSNNTAWQRSIELRDTGAGAPDVAHGDGIYARQLRVSAFGVYQIEFFARSRGRSTYSVRAGSRLEDGDKCCGNALPTAVRAEDELRRVLAQQTVYDKWSQQEWLYTIETGPFERYAPMLTMYMEETTSAGAAADNATTGADNAELLTAPLARILDLRAQYTVDELTFEWTPYDEWQVAAPVQYELRYGATMRDLVDHVDQLPLLATISAPQAGVSQHYVHNLTQTPLLYDGIWCFALRPLLESPERKVAQPLRLSNIVQLYVPAQQLPTTVSPMTLATDAAGELSNSANTSDVHISGAGGASNVTAIELSTYQQLQRYLLPIGIALLLLLLAVLCICCYMTRWRRGTAGGTSSVEHSKMQEAAAQPTGAPEHSFVANSNASYSAITHAHSHSFVASSYGMLNESMPDHHTVGIPIYSEDVMNGHAAGSKQGLSISGGSLAPSPAPQHCDSVHTISGSQLAPPYYYANEGQERYVHEGCDSWSAKQQQQQQQQQQAPAHTQYEPLLDERVPPVPPLPMAMPATILLEQNYRHLHEHSYPHDYQLYAPQQQQQQQQQQQYVDGYGPPPPPPPTYSTISRSHTSIHDDLGATHSCNTVLQLAQGNGELPNGYPEVARQTPPAMTISMTATSTSTTTSAMPPMHGNMGDVDVVGLPTAGVAYDDRRRRNVTMV